MTLSLEMQSDVLLATLSGEISESLAASRIKDVLRYAADKRATKILANCLAVTGKLSIMERYSLAITAVTFARSTRINPRVAIVGLPPTFDGFALRVAINRGGKGALFSDLETALDWLKHTR